MLHSVRGLDFKVVIMDEAHYIKNKQAPLFLPHAPDTPLHACGPGHVAGHEM